MQACGLQNETWIKLLRALTRTPNVPHFRQNSSTGIWISHDWLAALANVIAKSWAIKASILLINLFARSETSSTCWWGTPRALSWVNPSYHASRAWRQDAAEKSSFFRTFMSRVLPDPDKDQDRTNIINVKLCHTNFDPTHNPPPSLVTRSKQSHAGG
jgi:hypothetical protein